MTTATLPDYQPHLRLCKKGEPLLLPTGIHLNLSREEYERIPAYNQSLIKSWLELRDLPEEFLHWWASQANRTVSDSMLLGSALDCQLLEPLFFTTKFVVLPEDAPKKPSITQINAAKPSPATVEAIRWWKQWAEDSAGKHVLNAKQLDIVHGMANALLSEPATADIFTHCKKAVAIAEIDGFPVKAEFDLWNPESDHLLDLKAMDSVQPRDFASSLFNYGYHHQTAWYLAVAQAIGHDKRVFDFVTVMNHEPFLPAVHSLAPDMQSDHRAILDEALTELRDGMRSLAACVTSNKWPTFEHYALLPIPGWKVRQAERAA